MEIHGKFYSIQLQDLNSFTFKQGFSRLFQGNAIKAGCTASVRNELEGFKFDFAEVLGLWDTS